MSTNLRIALIEGALTEDRVYRQYKDGHCPYCLRSDSDWDTTNGFKRHLKECMAKKKYDQLITDGIEHEE